MQQKQEKQPSGAPKAWKMKLQSRAAKNGAYASAFSALVVALVVAVNLIVSALPAQYTSVDLTDQKLFSLSEESKQLAAGLTSDINIYYLVRSGQEDVVVQSLLNRYEGLSEHIKVEQKDPVIYPTFAAQYDAVNAAVGSVIVDGNNGRTRVIDAAELYEETYDYQTYAQTTSFAGESRLTSALSYVAREDLPIVYLLTGHNEVGLYTSYANMLADGNLQTAELNLLTQESVPEDAGMVLVNVPDKDLSEDEAKKLSAYLETGGSLLLVTNYGQYTVDGMPNLTKIMADYGLAAQEGVVVESNQDYYLSGYPHYLLPAVEQHEITKPLAESYLIAPVAHGLTVNQELAENIQNGALLTTTTDAYLKQNVKGNEAFEKTDDDLQGTFAVATVAQNTDDNSKVVWMATSGFFDDNMDQVVGGANSDFVLNTINWGVDNEEGITLHAKMLGSEQLLVPQAAGSLWSSLFCIVLPLGMLGIGVAIWAKRRKR